MARGTAQLDERGLCAGRELNGLFAAIRRHRETAEEQRRSESPFHVHAATLSDDVDHDRLYDVVMITRPIENELERLRRALCVARARHYGQAAGNSRHVPELPCAE